MHWRSFVFGIRWPRQGLIAVDVRPEYTAQMPAKKTDLDIRRYAVVGAEARLLEIAQEAEAIHRAFPELRGRRGQSLHAIPIDGSTSEGGARRRRSKMSAAERKAVSERMKKYWAGRRSSSNPATGGKPQQSEAPGKKAEGRNQAPRKMSAAARRRISRAQKARWAKVRARARNSV